MGARGEGTIRFRGEALPILLTNRALADVETATGRTVVQIAKAGETGQIGIAETAHLLRAGLEYGRRDAAISAPVHHHLYRLDEAYEIMDDLGFVPVLQVVMMALAAVLSYRGEGSDKRPPA